MTPSCCVLSLKRTNAGFDSGYNESPPPASDIAGGIVFGVILFAILFGLIFYGFYRALGNDPYRRPRINLWGGGRSGAPTSHLPLHAPRGRAGSGRVANAPRAAPYSTSSEFLPVYEHPPTYEDASVSDDASVAMSPGGTESAASVLAVPPEAHTRPGRGRGGESASPYQTPPPALP